MMFVPSPTGSSTEMIIVDPADLEIAQLRDTAVASPEILEPSL